ncbi:MULTISPECIES: 3-hydroxyacyl-CoA dehydrogenase NAD-binding domain-containing protein [Methylorubrum]|uniref:3-hydroxyacyl-CoA dehydrogenase NAD-binding domain-containing protein n=1 Tax=Methylorubrum TaxID=2282523 RepID=UPI003460A27A|nr:3-hydroxyacyl-CoA dehydrogenase [Methylorubrum zatmanii]MCP1553071.1 3-hydroxyacyl-CoA dehydrogenase [Methylorubrum extorquens]
MTDQTTGEAAQPADLRRQGRIGVITMNAPPVNALGAGLRRAIRARIEEAEADPEIGSIVLTGAGRLFSAGADIAEFDHSPDGPDLGALIDRVEDARKPVVAAIHGQALGGGLELALACHHRLATPSAKLGLPEVRLGLVPGAGGTQRLPRLVGPRAALEMIATGTPLSAKGAQAAGLIDAITAEDGLVADAVTFAEALLAEGRPIRRTRDRTEHRDAARDEPGLFDAFRTEQAKLFRGFEAPEACLACVRAATERPFAEGLAFERDTFLRLMRSAQSIAQRHVFFAEREVARIPDLPADTPTRTIARVGIIGAGTMGGGIAMNFLNAGLPVTIVEAAPEALERGLGIIRRNYEASAKKGRIRSEDVAARMALLTDSLDFDALSECDLVIEAVYEDMAIKRSIFERLDRIAKPGAILATNTSFLNVDAIAAVTRRPQDVIGLHFFSPANVMRLLEVVRAEKTAPDVVATAMRLARTIGKIAVQVGVCHGFVGNRLLDQRQREADRLILDGARPSDVDRVIQGFGLPMGPFAMMDLVGLDLGWSREISRGESVRDILCERDRRGQKTGAGFYDYDEARRATPSPEAEAVIREVAKRRGIPQRSVSDQEILERCLYLMVNEGAKILAEGKAWRASDIDVVWINGFGWPVYMGGPMHWGDTVGLPRIVETLRNLELAHGPDFQPAPLLEELAAEGSTFAAFDRQRSTRRF